MTKDSCRPCCTSYAPVKQARCLKLPERSPLMTLGNLKAPVRSSIASEKSSQNFMARARQQVKLGAILDANWDNGIIITVPNKKPI